MNKTTSIILASVWLINACGNRNELSDAYGNFEAKEIIISAETNGIINDFHIEEGQSIRKGDTIGFIDTIQLSLKKQQLLAQKRTTATKIENILSQINIQKEQRKNLEKELDRIKRLHTDGATSDKQLDDMTGNINVIDKQIESIKTQNNSVFNELEIYNKQIEQIQEQINRSIIISPTDGTILEKYVERHEMAITGKSLYKIADLSEMYLKVYISGAQLPHIKIGQKTEVIIDNNQKETRTLEGIVNWISAQAEFTPKIIQTKEERVILVYAVKIIVKNNGTLKIGMPGEINFKTKF